VDGAWRMGYGAWRVANDEWVGMKISTHHFQTNTHHFQTDTHHFKPTRITSTVKPTFFCRPFPTDPPIPHASNFPSGDLW
jgi:hypothetical protein